MLFIFLPLIAVADDRSLSATRLRDRYGGTPSNSVGRGFDLRLTCLAEPLRVSPVDTRCKRSNPVGDAPLL
jgi:hypothetical protein